MNNIIIIGAGLAGLSAAMHLRNAGINAQILEARNRIGGRVLTDYQLGLPLSCGAAWIHGNDGNPMTELARKTNTPMIPIVWGSASSEFMIFDQVGHVLDQHVVQQFNDKFSQILQRAQEKAFVNDLDISLADALQPEIHAACLTPIEKTLLQRKLYYFEGYLGAGYEKLSARYFNLEEMWPGDNCYISNGFDSIVHFLSEKCDIKLNTVVKEIHIEKDGVSVITNHSTYTAEKVLITVPLGVLKSNAIAFYPRLPERKRNAIQQLGMGLLNITAIKFPEAFWSREATMFVQTHIKPFSIPAFFNLHQLTGVPVLIGYHGGDRSRQIETLTNMQLQEHIMQDLKRLFGSKCRDPLDIVTTRWSTDPFSLGSYSYVAVNATMDDYDALAEPVADRLYFAGEATIGRYMATTHGAYLSGKREAERLLEN